MSTKPEPDRPSDVARKGAGDTATWVAASVGASPGEAWADELSHRAAEAAAAGAAAADGLRSLQDSQGLLDQVTSRWANIGQGQFAGYLQEFHHSATFNASAAEAGSAARSIITGFEGLQPNPASPADLLIVDRAGHVLSEVQSKSVGSVSERVMQLASEKYEGMQLLVPSDHVGATQDFIDRRIDMANPDFLKHHAYEDVHGRLTEAVTWNDIHSSPMSSAELQQAAASPHSYFQSVLDDQRARMQEHLDAARDATNQLPLAELSQVVGASAAGGLTAAGFTILMSGVRSAAQVRAGEVSASAASVTAVSQASGAFIRGAIISGGAQALRIAADNGLAIDALANGTLAFAVARATWDIGAIGIRLAQGEIEPDEAAGQMGVSLLRIGCTYSCMVVGQALIPVPVVGALIGGTVGAVCAATIVQGMAMARAMADELHLAKEELARIEAEVEAAVVVLNAEIEWLQEFTRQQDIAFREVLLPNIQYMSMAITGGAFADALPAITEIIVAFGQRPVFTTMGEFERWMDDPDTRLVLRTNPSP